MKYVIIGNSAAGIGAVEGIRGIDKQGEITVVSNEPHHTYSRPLISYLLSGKTSLDKIKYRSDDFYETNNTKLLNTEVAEINPENKSVILSDGKSLPYDKLLVATGSSAFIPPFAGLEKVKNKFTFMSLDDAISLDGVLNCDKRVLIIGAGLIGLKCAEGISAKAKSVTVVDLAPRILSSILDGDGAKTVQEHIESKGINFKLSASVKEFNENSAVFEDGEILDFDILVLAVGVRPNTSLLAGIADIDRGIIVNSKSQTSVNDIYAAGDCTQTVDISSGQSKIMALLPNAYMQGETAGINMAGSEEPKVFDKAVPMNAIGFFGLHIITAGNYEGEVYEKPGKKLFYSDNKLNGYILIGDVEKAGIYTSLIRERTDLNTIDFELICEKPGLMAFTRQEREIKLGGGV